MMCNTGLFEHDTKGPTNTCSNRQTENLICSRIDRAIVNAEWFIAFPNSKVDVLNPHISDHSPLRLSMDTQLVFRKHRKTFTFLNCIVEHLDFLDTVRENWTPSDHGAPMVNLWKNMQRLQ